jgi:hypothetical protein
MTDLDHPCKQTCSGWKQGFEAGAKESAELRAKLDSARLAMEHARNFLVNTHDRDEAVVILGRELSVPGARASPLCKRCNGLRTIFHLTEGMVNCRECI